MRRLVGLLAAASLAAAPAALAHGGAIDDAVEALASTPVYVDPDAQPTLSDAQAQQLAARIRESGRSIYVAVIDAQADPAHDVVHEIVGGVGRPGTYVVVAGGQFGMHSTEFEHERSEELQAEADARPKTQLARTLDRLVTQIAATSVATASKKDEGAPWVWVVVGLLALGVVAAALTAVALRRARRPDLPAGPPPPA